jgi:transcriptional regulator with XRE-family HTH domain
MLLRKAREEAGLTQEELARLGNRHLPFFQGGIEQIDCGGAEITSWKIP